MNQDHQEKLFSGLTDLVCNMARLVNSLDLILQKIDAYETFFAGYGKTLRRIENKIDTVTVQTIKEEYVEDVEDYSFKDKKLFRDGEC